MAENNVAIHITNSALYRLGEQPISSFDQGTATSDLAKELYPDIRDTLLSWQAWPFATVRQPLARLAVTPPSDFGYYYAIPTIPAVLRLIDIDLINRRIDYQREVYVNPADPNDQQQVIATDAMSVVLRYVGRTSEGIWSGLFVATMAVYLAQAMAPSISGKASLKNALLAELYGTGREPGLLGKLRDVAGYEDSPREMPLPTSYLTVREDGAGASHIHWNW